MLPQEGEKEVVPAQGAPLFLNIKPAADSANPSPQGNPKLQNPLERLREAIARAEALMRQDIEDKEKFLFITPRMLKQLKVELEKSKKAAESTRAYPAGLFVAAENLKHAIKGAELDRSLEERGNSALNSIEEILRFLSRKHKLLDEWQYREIMVKIREEMVDNNRAYNLSEGKLSPDAQKLVYQKLLEIGAPPSEAMKKSVTDFLAYGPEARAIRMVP